MKKIVSCRCGVLGKPPEAFERLAACGLSYAEVAPPEDGDFATLKARADAAGITIATFGLHLKLSDADSHDAVKRTIEGAASIGTTKLFCAMDGPFPMTDELVYALLDTLAFAAERGVMLCMETHEPYAHNAARAIVTLERVNALNLRLNFNTANLYYYNEGGINAVTELETCREWVGAVHLKDTMGEFHSAEFPIFGQGVVGFPRLFELLDEIGFQGPYTIEPEGACLDRHEAGPDDFIRQCAAYLRKIGALG